MATSIHLVAPSMRYKLRDKIIIPLQGYKNTNTKKQLTNLSRTVWQP